MKYLIIIEASKTGYSAYLPDVPGCVSTGKTPSEVRKNVREALALHLQGLKAEGLPMPASASKSSYVEVGA